MNGDLKEEKINNTSILTTKRQLIVYGDHGVSNKKRKVNDSGRKSLSMRLKAMMVEYAGLQQQ
jgi:hypothetical protein